VITTSSGERKIPVVASKGEASWLEEGQAIPESDDSFGQVTIGAYKLGTMLKISEELLNDSAFALEAYVVREFARRTGAKEEDAFLNGDGTGKPTGILAATGGGQIGVTTAGATAITLDEMLDLYHALKTPYRRSAAFITNDATVKALRKLKDNNGVYLWQPSIKEGTPDTILNRPLITSAFMPGIAAGAKTVVFGDFRYYWIADRQGRIFRRLNELFAVNGQVGFIATQRVDGKLILPEAVKILQMKSS
jgi:HK97 family phage major capsid protein